MSLSQHGRRIRRDDIELKSASRDSAKRKRITTVSRYMFFKGKPRLLRLNACSFAARLSCSYSSFADVPDFFTKLANGF